MKTDYDERITYHINIPDMQADGSAVLFEFMCKHMEKDNPDVVDSAVPVWIPAEVLQSWVNAFPKILADMQERQEMVKTSSGPKN